MAIIGIDDSLLRETSLMTPGKVPTGPCVLNKAHSLANRLTMAFVPFHDCSSWYWGDMMNPDIRCRQARLGVNGEITFNGQSNRHMRGSAPFIKAGNADEALAQTVGWSTLRQADDGRAIYTPFSEGGLFTICALHTVGTTLFNDPADPRLFSLSRGDGALEHDVMLGIDALISVDQYRARARFRDDQSTVHTLATTDDATSGDLMMVAGGARPGEFWLSSIINGQWFTEATAGVGTLEYETNLSDQRRVQLCIQCKDNTEFPEFQHCPSYGVVWAILGWDRLVSKEELSSVYHDPYQMFMPA